MAINVGREPTKDEMEKGQGTTTVSTKPGSAQELIPSSEQPEDGTSTGSEDCDGASQSSVCLTGKETDKPEVKIVRKNPESFFQRIKRLNKAAESGKRGQHASRKTLDTSKPPQLAPAKRKQYYQEVSSSQRAENPNSSNFQDIRIDGSSDEDVSIFDKVVSPDGDAKMSRQGSSLARLRRLGSSILQTLGLGRCMSGGAERESGSKGVKFRPGSAPRLVFDELSSPGCSKVMADNTDGEDILSMIHKPLQSHIGEASSSGDIHRAMNGKTTENIESCVSECAYCQ